jgi:hypothetical protein
MTGPASAVHRRHSIHQKTLRLCGSARGSQFFKSVGVGVYILLVCSGKLITT